MNVRRAEKLPLFPGYYFLMIGILVPRRATFQHLNRCPPWTGKDELYWIMPPCVDASRARSLSAKSLMRWRRNTRLAPLGSKLSREKQRITSARAPELFKTAQAYSKRVAGASNKLAVVEPRARGFQSPRLQWKVSWTIPSKIKGRAILRSP